MSKILVTGGTGYIGSHTVVELQNAGYDVVIVDNLDNSSIQILDQITEITGKKPEFYELDLCDEAATVDLIAKNPDISGVIHFAAHKAVGESVQKPLKYYRNNFFSLINLLTAFAGREVNFVFSSSCTVYGQPDKLPVTEEAPVKRAESPYGNTKQIAEEILVEVSGANSNYHVISLRYFNPVGAHESALIGELPIGVPQNLVPFITQSAIGKRGPITVFGDDYNTPDGSCVRDYIHVVDLAKAHIAALRRQEEAKMSGNFEIFNIGTGKGSSVLEVIKAFEESTGVKLDYKIGPRRAGDVEQVWGDVSKAENELGWKAELGLEDMMKSAWAWENYIKEHPFN
ncbi:UDP-glucose 4-epimerase GalE [Pedobacter sp. SYSU D00535]|uniref:UDP-glucose 4-epimerase GalE n=1 Tax=Pedobacter sp. SYSU D00535 TaxID=2810308 RepID=UPI001A95A8DA|nr:UDP-glucose 4-epimerase GalE [Pedobacter sp. SYSU D00535]